MKKVSKLLPQEASKVLNNPEISSLIICHHCLYRERRKTAVVLGEKKMDATRNMYEKERKKPRSAVQSLAKNYRRPFPAGRQRNCHIWCGCSREVMMIMMIERNRRQKVEEIKKIQESNGRVRCGGMKQITRATWSNLKRQEKKINIKNNGMILPLLRKMIEIRVVYDLWDDWGRVGGVESGKEEMCCTVHSLRVPVAMIQDVDQLVWYECFKRKNFLKKKYIYI
jgi:hypothetical protein